MFKTDNLTLKRERWRGKWRRTRFVISTIPTDAFLNLEFIAGNEKKGRVTEVEERRQIKKGGRYVEKRVRRRGKAEKVIKTFSGVNILPLTRRSNGQTSEQNPFTRIK